MDTRIYDTMTSNEIAYIIFQYFQVDQSCTVTGFEKIDGRHNHKGKYVLDSLLVMDRAENMFLTKQGMKRKAKKWANSVGGHKASKCFRWDFKMIDNEPRYIIWRVQ